jgi:hypothetical protein
MHVAVYIPYGICSGEKGPIAQTQADPLRRGVKMGVLPHMNLEELEREYSPLREQASAVRSYL